MIPDPPCDVSIPILIKRLHHLLIGPRFIFRVYGLAKAVVSRLQKRYEMCIRVFSTV
jgi:hypothetical protein